MARPGPSGGGPGWIEEGDWRIWRRGELYVRLLGVEEVEDVAVSRVSGETRESDNSRRSIGETCG